MLGELVVAIAFSRIGKCRWIFVPAFDAVNSVAQIVVYVLRPGSIGEENLEMIIKHKAPQTGYSFSARTKQYGYRVKLSFSFALDGIVQLTCCTKRDRFGNKSERHGACLSTPHKLSSGSFSHNPLQPPFQPPR